MAFDVRVGLFDDPPSKETKKMLKMIKAVFDGFALLGKMNSGWEGLLYRFIKTPSYKKIRRNSRHHVFHQPRGY